MVEYSPAVVGGGGGGGPSSISGHLQYTVKKKILSVNISFYFYIGMSRGAANLPLTGKGDRSTALGVLMSQIIRLVRAMHGRAARLIPI